MNAEQDKKLDLLDPVMKAYYRSGVGYRRLEDTRTTLLEQIMVWLRYFKELSRNAHDVVTFVFWLFGLAGSGESSVANTIV